MKSPNMKRLAAILAIAAIGSAGAIGAPAGENIQNIGTFEYLPDGGSNTPTQVTTPPVTLTVGQVYDVLVTPDGTVDAPGQTVTGSPGSTGVLTYTVTNTGNGTDSIHVSGLVGNPGSAAATASLYQDSNGNGIYDAGVDTAVTNLTNIAADQSATIFAVVNVAANATQGAITTYNLVGTSAGDTTQIDSNNVGAITSNRVVDLTLDPDHLNTPAVAGAPITLSHTLTNTGNGTIDPTTLSVTVTNTGTFRSISYTVTNNSTGTTTAANTDLAAALNAAGSLPAGQSYTINATYTLESAAAGSTSQSVISVVSTEATTTTLINNATTAEVDTDSFVMQVGNANFTKTAQNCGLDATCANPTNDVTAVKPGEYALYTLTVFNDGTAGLQFPTLRDYVPFNTIFQSVSGTASNGAVVYGTSGTGDRSTTAWGGTAPTTLNTSTNPTSGPYIYVGNDTNGDGNMTSADLLAPNGTLTMRLIVKIRDTGATNP